MDRADFSVTVALIVLAKAPVPGQVKTRLCPPCTATQAAAIAEASLADTLTTVAAVRAPRRLLALDGEPGPWVPDAFEVVPQLGGGLGDRLANAFERAGGPAFLVGMDTPQLTPALLAHAARELRSADAALGLAVDGGYWGIGLRNPVPEAFADVPMSTPRTGAAQRNRLRGLGLRVRDLPILRDVDTYQDALAVARLVPPESAFASTVWASVGQLDVEEQISSGADGRHAGSPDWRHRRS
jgi:uncharacterized protein